MKHALMAMAMVVAALLWGCEREEAKGPDPRLEAEIARLESEGDGLRTHADRLAKALADSESASDDHRRRVDELTLEVGQLKRQTEALAQAAREVQGREARSRKEVEDLKDSLARALAAVAAPPSVGGPKPPAKPPPRSTAPDPEKVNRIADVEQRMKNLRMQIDHAQGVVTTLSRSTIDVPMQLPSSACYVRGGHIYRQSRSSSGRYYYSPYDERLGPAVKQGDFRTQLDKNRAIAVAKANLIPLYQDMEGLKRELAQLKK